VQSRKENVFLVPGVLAHTCNPSSQGANARGLGVPGWFGLHSETLFQKGKKRRVEEKKGEKRKCLWNL
jgi:hypothetical protein